MRTLLAAIIMIAVATSASATDRMIIFNDHEWVDLVQALDAARKAVPLLDLSKVARTVDKLATAQTVVERKEEAAPAETPHE